MHHTLEEFSNFMRFKVNPQSSVPLYAQIVEQIRNQIFSGRLKKTMPLPSVREFAEMLEVNSLTIQKALKLLEQEKYILIKRGVGAFVSDNIEIMNAHDRELLLSPNLNNIVLQAKELGITHPRLEELVNNVWNTDQEIEVKKK